MEFSQFFAVRPKPKGRPRMSRRGFAYTPPETLQFEKKIADLYEGPMFEEDRLCVHLKFSEEGIWFKISPAKKLKMVKGGKRKKLRGDIDNYAKSVLDALNGVAYADDKQIVLLMLEKE
jgi:Holliday junction resolvase RusA-like endonuclease